ncbi:hypothetical protein GCM10009654_15010 [Streptomyces hebeiensis]|uniref:Uncharacterized protein n=1 Tax=Streptomyces hebeiensis TaxID=229486 RepID=A0ABP4FBA4_9ACTN
MDTYGGLRAAIAHPDCGEIDAVALSFVAHGTFHRRDEAHNIRPDTKQYGTFDTNFPLGSPLWEGAVTTGLRDAIEQYTAVWFPGGWATSAPSRASGRTPHKAPVPPANRSGAAPAEPPSRSPCPRVPRGLPGRSPLSCRSTPSTSTASTLPRP